MVHVLGVSRLLQEDIFYAIFEVEEELEQILDMWITLDDNEAFFKFICPNISDFLYQVQKTKPPYFSGEDLIWFRGLLKNISYYNKRFVFPE